MRMPKKIDTNDIVPRALLRSLFDSALGAVDPLNCVPGFLPPRPKGRTLVLGAGKASARMARAVEAVWDGPLTGLVVTRYGHSDQCARIKVVESGHPVPDDTGATAARQMLAMAQDMGPDDLVLALVSGGGSSLITLPAEGLSMEDLRTVNVGLLRSGAKISEMNMVRRHLSRIKGGRLAHACGAAAVHTLVVSDVPGDDPAVVASGPTVADRSSPLEALTVLVKHRINVPPAVIEVLRRQPFFQRSGYGPRHVQVIATAELALNAAVAEAKRLELDVINLGGAVEGESRKVAEAQAAMAMGLRSVMTNGATPKLLLSGGETTVTVQGNGRGGRNSEFLLSLALELHGQEGIHAIACDTDGIDGVEDNAGGIIDPESLQRAGRLGLNPRALLDNNDAYTFLSTLGDLITTGPTRTNVNDFRALLIT